MKTEQNLDYIGKSFDFIKDSSTNKCIIFTLSSSSHSHHHINLH